MTTVAQRVTSILVTTRTPLEKGLTAVVEPNPHLQHLCDQEVQESRQMTTKKSADPNRPSDPTRRVLVEEDAS